MERSGATVARDFFGLAPHLTPAQAQLFAHVKDVDLWRWRLPGSRAFLAGLRAAVLAQLELRFCLVFIGFNGAGLLPLRPAAAPPAPGSVGVSPRAARRRPPGTPRWR